MSKISIVNQDLIKKYINTNQDNLITLIIELSKIPSWTGNEKDKSKFILKKLREFGAKDAYTDEIYNVLYFHKVNDSKEYFLVSAHIDTVFTNLTEIVPIIKGDIIYAPSVSDNSSNIAAVLLYIKMILNNSITAHSNILFAFNVREEGLGNSEGIKHILDKQEIKPKSVVVIDGSCNSIITRFVGSKRYEVNVTGKGGRSWKEFGILNPIEVLSRFISRIYDIDVQKYPEKVTYNVGKIVGGNSINSIPTEAKCFLEIRALSQQSLNEVEKEIYDLSRQYENLNLKVLGKRPCGSTDNTSYILEQILNVRNNLMMKTKFGMESTDSNIPSSMNIPTITFGTRIGKKNHSLDEQLCISSMNIGMLALYIFLTII